MDRRGSYSSIEDKMSHLSTIIKRVNQRLSVYDGSIQEARKDSLFKQSVRNLMEYQEAWTDYTEEEKIEADRLYAIYSKYI
jgi:hypothetical protein